MRRQRSAQMVRQAHPRIKYGAGYERGVSHARVTGIQVG